MKSCNQCGKCCLKYSDGGLSATAAEIDWWEDYRPHIAAHVKNGQIWMSPTTGLPLKVCPFLEKDPDGPVYSCSIYHDRPEDCRHYPVNITQMVQDECEMLEVKDLSDTRRAQINLDKLMIDSRPS